MAIVEWNLSGGLVETFHGARVPSVSLFEVVGRCTLVEMRSKAGVLGHGEFNNARTTLVLPSEGF